AGMLKHHHLARAIAEVGFAEFRRQLAYKAVWYGARVVLADRWAPSSKTCSGCGWVDEELRRADRTIRCRNPHAACGLVLDRDLNAAITLSKLAHLAGVPRTAKTPVEQPGAPAPSGRWCTWLRCSRNQIWLVPRQQSVNSGEWSMTGEGF